MPNRKSSHQKGAAWHGRKVKMFEDVSKTHPVVLQVLRLFCMSYAKPGSQMWEKALESASRQFGDAIGPQIAASVSASLTALRAVRKGSFGFKNPFCANCHRSLSGDERHFLCLLDALHRDDAVECQTQLLILCEGQDAAAFMRSMTQLAGYLAELCPASQTKQPKTKSRLQFNYR